MDQTGPIRSSPNPLPQSPSLTLLIQQNDSPTYHLVPGSIISRRNLRAWHWDDETMLWRSNNRLKSTESMQSLTADVT
jgi:hypothetical protein